MSLRRFLKHTAAGRWLLAPFRLGYALTFPCRQAWRAARWSVVSKEHYNHTYHLTPLNRSYLASFVAMLSGHDTKRIEGYMDELEGDAELRAELDRAFLGSSDRHNSDREPRYGRRLGWYALARATKPRVVVETGVDRGLGTVVLAAALRRNAREGAPGRVLATDINPACGHLFAGPYRELGEVLLGDSVALLRDLKEPVDVFIHDSDHRPEYEWAEFLAVEPHLHGDSIVLSDNSQQSAMLRDFAGRLGKCFAYFQDEPLNHWWPGDGLGAAFVPGRRIQYQPERGDGKGGA